MSARASLVAGAAALALATSACSARPATDAAAEAAAPTATISTIDVAALTDLVARDKVVLVDVRTPGEFAEGHIAGAVNLPLQGFDPGSVPHEAGKQTILYCRSGRRSEAGAEKMVAAGEAATHLGGGITAWQEAGEPVTSGG
ncbi:rhodanese-like domain-containing protein [Tsuneonella sp. YG55]|uniref:Rhodanese-like domain-containing protein n=1 Tax=Tsuneonella litorea TaxID=2976475 RepID=A0A9X3A8A7_9SPHN|nr:rhodanese-like domain-containing protein [Tsuneonella litorea]MCT2559276.1 rhodanese-like domain-containing protein [Tsuneonella litorea]